MEPVDTSTLEKTVSHLVLSLQTYTDHRDGPVGEVLRSAVVQNFNVCWGRIRPTISRALIRLDGLDPEDVKQMSLGQLLRTANEHGYSTLEWEQWKRFLDARNESADAYNQAIADAILNEAPHLVTAANEVLAAVRGKQAS